MLTRTRCPLRAGTSLQGSDCAVGDRHLTYAVHGQSDRRERRSKCPHAVHALRSCFNSYSSKDVLCFDNQEIVMSQNVTVLLDGSQRINTSSEPGDLKAVSQRSMKLCEGSSWVTSLFGGYTPWVAFGHDIVYLTFVASVLVEQLYTRHFEWNSEQSWQGSSPMELSLLGINLRNIKYQVVILSNRKK